LFLKYKGKTVEVPISNNGKTRLEKLEEKDLWDSDSGDMFDELTYEDEELNKAEGYYMEKVLDKEDELYNNLWKDETSPAIYLTNIDELITEVQDESTVIEQLEKFVQTDSLDEKEKRKALEFFRKEVSLFASRQICLCSTTI
ncbi:1_t:CDS:1, partial [Cetraspora pellucida]